MVTYTRPRNARLRVQVFAHYGDTCRCCGTRDRLSIDHINGGGKEHRATNRSTERMYRWLIANGFPEGFQVLCVPCNKSKGPREQCSLDHTSGGAIAMTSAERARNWRKRQAALLRQDGTGT